VPAGPPAGLAADGMDAGFDQTGADSIDADAFAGHFARQPQRQGIDGPLQAA
jgi:hypothetical protein